MRRNDPRSLKQWEKPAVIFSIILIARQVCETCQDCQVKEGFCFEDSTGAEQFKCRQHLMLMLYDELDMFNALHPVQ